MRGPSGWWRRKNTPAKVETYTRWSFHFFAVMEGATAGLTVLSQVNGWLAATLLVLAGVHTVLGGMTASRALDWTRGRRAQPVRLLWLLSAVTAVFAVTAIGIAGRGPEGEHVDSAAGALHSVILAFGAGFISLGVRNRRRVFAIVGGFSAGSAFIAFPMGLPGPAAFFMALMVLLGAGGLAFTAVFSVWLLNAVYELDAARETRARLAVAEERLRFGRDLHDVVGRNLAVIALKGELAVQLARRGRAEAVEQMIEVQRIARESQREVRDVVRGYREADLGVELAGAQWVLTAAGIRCEVTGGEASAFPAEVQSALGWVVREATTNVLRHGDAERCVVVVRVVEELSEGCVEELVVEGGPAEERVGEERSADGRRGRRAVLTVENDRARASEGSGGSGLAGLRERLAAVDGALEAGFTETGGFRVVAEVPLTRTVDMGDAVAVSDSAGVSDAVAASDRAAMGEVTR
ncbi:sensor histidine kinase [Streptomyces sp. NBC_00076]|uniref:sensor histidine kinase n=1 Tax=Streptomyces sp. NBC_00076 TaxID=2975642 RepID=UPI00324C4E55